MREDFHPWRRTVAFDATVHAADVRPLVERLSFIADPRRWGYPFRRGLFDVPEADFAVVEAAMRASPASRCPRGRTAATWLLSGGCVLTTGG